MARRSKNDEDFAMAIVVVFILAITIIYFLSKLFLGIGFLLIIFGVFFLFLSLDRNDEDLLKWAFSFIIVGMMLLTIGVIGIVFFGETELGRTLIEIANQVANTTGDIITP